MNIYIKLEQLNHNQFRIPQIKKYLLTCCVKYTKYRSCANLEKGIGVVKRFIADFAAWKQLHNYECITNGYTGQISAFTFCAKKRATAAFKKLFAVPGVMHHENI